MTVVDQDIGGDPCLTVSLDPRSLCVGTYLVYLGPEETGPSRSKGSGGRSPRGGREDMSPS